MKKFISVFLAALMLMSCFAVSSFAAVDTFSKMCICTDHIKGQPCTCCVLCPNPDIDKWNTCYRETCETDENGNLVNGTFCCKDCRGVVHNGSCGCACECCKGNENVEDGNHTFDNVITDQDKDNFVASFQEVIKKLSDFFNMVFDAIFEFLRIEEVLG